MALSRVTDQVRVKEHSEWLRQQSVVTASRPSGGESLGLNFGYLLSPPRKEGGSLIMAEQLSVVRFGGGAELELSDGDIANSPP